jgi:hypothetical protein
MSKSKIKKYYEFTTLAEYDGEKVNVIRRVTVKSPSGQVIGGWDTSDSVKEIIKFIEEANGIKNTARIEKMLTEM